MKRTNKNFKGKQEDMCTQKWESPTYIRIFFVSDITVHNRPTTIPSDKETDK